MAPLVAALALLALNSSVTGATDATDDINPADFTARIDNPFFPLPPGINVRARDTARMRSRSDSIEMVY